MFQWVKLITRSGRQSYVREKLSAAITPQSVADYAAKGVSTLLEKIKNKERLEKVSACVERAANLSADLAAAVRDGEVSSDEAHMILASVNALFGDVLTQENIAALIEKAVEKIP